MRLIIDIPEDLYREKILGTTSNRQDKKILECVKNGTPLSEEFEKIRAEIIACTQQEEGEVPACINYGIKLSTEIVEKHIAELKGE